jgi:hypothetical protein
MVEVTHPFTGVNFVSHYFLMVDTKINRLLDGITPSFTPAQATNSLVRSIKVMSGEQHSTIPCTISSTA